MPGYDLGISPLGSRGPLISGIWDYTTHFSGNGGACTGQLCSLVLSGLPRLCHGKTGDSARLLSLQLFLIMEFGAGGGRSSYRPRRVGEGMPCQATLFAQELGAVPCLWALPSNSSPQEPR